MESTLEEIEVGEEVLILEANSERYIGNVYKLKSLENAFEWATCHNPDLFNQDRDIVVRRFIRATPLLKALF
jgi:hypothetical protein